MQLSKPNSTTLQAHLCNTFQLTPTAFAIHSTQSDDIANFAADSSFARKVIPVRKVYVPCDVLKLDPPQLEGVERARRPARLLVVFTREEVKLIMARLEGTPLLVAGLRYGAGLRLMEAMLGGARFLFWLPAKDGLARGGGFV
jgi:integrase